jgi:predicted acetyltransferase
MQKFVGTIKLGDTVDITDPWYNSCYSSGTWGQMTTRCVPGTYYGYAEEVEYFWNDMRISRLFITKDSAPVDFKSMEKIGVAGVDYAMVGFFNKMPHFSKKGMG